MIKPTTIIINMRPQDLQPGYSYGCKFKVRTYMYNDEPVAESDIPEQPDLLTIGEWTSWGLIARRDPINQLLEVQDQKCLRTWTVHWDDVWDVDVAEYKKTT